MTRGSLRCALLAAAPSRRSGARRSCSSRSRSTTSPAATMMAGCSSPLRLLLGVPRRREARLSPGGSLSPRFRLGRCRARRDQRGAAVQADRLGRDAHRLGRRRDRQRVGADLRCPARDALRAARARHRRAASSGSSLGSSAWACSPASTRRAAGWAIGTLAVVLASISYAAAGPLRPAQARRLVGAARLDGVGALGNPRDPSLRDRAGAGRHPGLGGDRLGCALASARHGARAAAVPPASHAAATARASRRSSRTCCRCSRSSTGRCSSTSRSRRHGARRARADPRRGRARLGAAPPLSGRPRADSLTVEGDGVRSCARDAGRRRLPRRARDPRGRRAVPRRIAREGPRRESSRRSSARTEPEATPASS